MLTEAAYRTLFENFSNKRILVIGDVMIDAYLFGTVDRISPEAPVPVVAIGRRENRLGGAANVALNIKAMGATPILCSVVGQDIKGDEFADLIEDQAISADYLYRSPERLTTTKFRILASNTQMLRVDEEDLHSLTENEIKSFLAIFDRILKTQKIDAIVFEDYDKGVLCPQLIEYVIDKALENNIPTAVDPKKRNFSFYKNVSLFKPNLKEIKEGLKIELFPTDYEGIADATELLRTQLNAGVVMLTLSEEGVVVREENKFTHYPAQIRQIADVSGAGDTVISLATLCLSEGLNAADIAYIANMSGGLVCEEVGVVPINKESLLKELIKNG